MINHPVRLAVFDIDGTLIGRAHPLGQGQITALRGLHEAGITLALASSRQRASLLDLADVFGVPLYLISYNGPLVNAPDGRQIAVCEVEIPAALAEALAAFVAEGGCVHVYGQTTWQAYGPDWRIDNEATGGGMVPDVRARRLEPSELPARALKIMCDGPRDVLGGVSEVVARYPSLVLSWSGTECHDIHAATATKGHGLQRLADDLRIDTAHTVAFGDADSDISMLRAAGTGFAMGAAPDRVIAAADARLGAPGSGELEVLLGDIARAQRTG